MKEHLFKGSKVAWDGYCDPMAGTIEYIGFDHYDVKRVDGGMCTVKKYRCRKATTDDIDKAIKTFAIIGK